MLGSRLATASVNNNWKQKDNHFKAPFRKNYSDKKNNRIWKQNRWYFYYWGITEQIMPFYTNKYMCPISECLE